MHVVRRYGLGFQIGSCADGGPLQRANVESKIVNEAVTAVNNAVTAVRGRGIGIARELGVGVESAKVAVLGHASVGGTIGLCVPSSGLGLAVTVSRLSGQKVATTRLLELMLGEMGLQGLQGLPG